MTTSAVVVIPAYNEAASIRAIVGALRETVDVIVVNDASTDATAAESEVAGAHVVTHAQNGGYGGSIDSGVRAAIANGYRYVVTMDADGQHDPAETINVVRLLTGEGFDLVVGVRDNVPRLAERIFALYTRRRFGLHDPLCGVKGYDVRFVEEYGGFDLRDSVGTELALHAIRAGAHWTEVPITVHRRHDESRYGHSMRANLRIWRALAHAIRLGGSRQASASKA